MPLMRSSPCPRGRTITYDEALRAVIDMRVLPAGLLHLFGFDHSTPLVVAAVRTNMVWKFGLVTLWAGREVGKFEPLVGSSLAAS